MFRGALPARSNRESFVDLLELVCDDDGLPFDLTGATAQVSLVSDREWAPCTSSTIYYDRAFTPATLISAGVFISEAAGVIEFTFTRDQMASLTPGQYALACTVTRDGETTQIIIGNLPVLDGIVPL
jgi:hypothetical protein